MENDEKVLGISLIILAFIIGAVASGFLYNDMIKESRQQTMNCEFKLQRDNDLQITGLALNKLFDQYENIFNSTDLIIDCQNETVFPEDRYAVCVIRPSDSEGSYFVTMRLNFSKVD